MLPSLPLREETMISSTNMMSRIQGREVTCWTGLDSIEQHAVEGVLVGKPTAHGYLLVQEQMRLLFDDRASMTALLRTYWRCFRESTAGVSEALSRMRQLLRMSVDGLLLRGSVDGLQRGPKFVGLQRRRLSEGAPIAIEQRLYE